MALDDDPGHHYDSFVVRVWHERDTGALLRAEVEHVQSGTSETEVGASWEWVGTRLRRRVDGASQQTTGDQG